MAEYWRLSEPACTFSRKTGSLMGMLERKWITAAEPCLLTRADTGAPEMLIEEGDFKIS